MEYPKEDNSVQKTRKNLTKPISPIRHPIIEKPKHSKKNESDDQKFISQTPILKKKNKRLNQSNFNRKPIRKPKTKKKLDTRLFLSNNSCETVKHSYKQSIF